MIRFAIALAVCLIPGFAQAQCVALSGLDEVAIAIRRFVSLAA